MNRQNIPIWLIAWLAATVGGAILAATPDAPETWDSGGVGGWTRQDPLNACTQPLDNPTNYLQVVFEEQSMSFPQVHIVRADANASKGDFAADYWSAGITNVSFKLYCKTHLPARLCLYFYGSTSGNWWYYPLGVSQVGKWTQYSVMFDYWTGWRLGSGGHCEQFKMDLKDVAWIGIAIQRNSSVEQQVYGLDNFVLYGADRSKDSDGDGMNDWHEFIAGTDAGEMDSLLEVGISVTNRPEKVAGIVLRWKSAPNRTYAIDRATSLLEGFTRIESGIPAAMLVNEYEDVTATNGGPYFYRIGVE